MTIITVGLNHRTAPIALREQLSLSGDDLRSALNALHQGPIQEVVTLSTCNRLETYAIVDNVELAYQQIAEYLAKTNDIALEELMPTLYFAQDIEAIEHLMKVASGLDSMILGEPQILGQVNTAFGEAHAEGTTKATISRLFTSAVHAGKRARTETNISRHTTSVSHAAVRLAQQQFRDLTKANVLIVGAGEMAQLAAQAMAKYDPAQLYFINRTCSRAEELAEEVGGKAINWTQLLEALGEADIVISSTGAPHPVIHAEELELVLPHRNGRTLMFIDIAVPRDIEEEIGYFDDVILYDIDELNRVVDENYAQRKASAEDVSLIIGQEVQSFIEWMQSREVVPVLVELRRKVAELAQTELGMALNRLDDLTDQEEKVIQKLTHRIVNKVLHEPTLRLKEQAVNGNGVMYAEVVANLFDLEAPVPMNLPPKQQKISDSVDLNTGGVNE